MTEFQLPAPQHDLARAVCDAVPRLVPFVRNIEPGQLFAALVAETNILSPNVDPRSVLISCMNASIIGLMPGPSLGLCYLIPFTNKCQLIIGYQGFLELAMRNNFLSICNIPQVVLRGETFEMHADERGNHFRHEIPVERAIAKPNVVGAYVTYATQAGGTDFVFMSRSELDQIDSGRNVWRSDPIAMYKKSTIRRAAHMWRKGMDLGRAVLIDEQADRGEDQECPEFSPDLDPGAEELANLQRTLDATLNSRVGCSSAEERNAVLQWALDVTTIDYTSVCQHADLIRDALNRINQLGKDGHWETVLPTATGATT